MLMRWVSAAFAMAVLVLAVAGCGDAEQGDGERAGTVINVGVLPIADSAPLYVGIKQGFFADEDLEVRPRVVQSGAVTIPAVVSGDFQFGWSNTTSLIIARSKGLALRFVSRGSHGGPNESGDASALLVKKGGPVRSARALEGTTIGVPALQSVTTLTTNAALEKRGVDISKVKFIEVAFPEALQALERGRVDAAFVAEPFMTLGLRAGHRIISRPIFETAPNYIAAAYFTSEKYIADHRDVVDRFVRAVHRSFDYATAHPQHVRTVLPTYTKIPAKVAQRMVLSDFSPYKDTSSLDLTVELAKKYGYIERKPAISELLYKP